MRRFLFFVPLLLALTVFALACSSGDGGNDGTPANSGVSPVAGNSELVVGPNRFAVGLIDGENRPVLGEPGTIVKFHFLQNGAEKFARDGVFVWAIPDTNGFWTADVDFDAAGMWSLQTDLARNGEGLDVLNAQFTVLAQSAYPNIGDEAPATENPTLATEPNIKKISSDPAPDERLYQMTVTQALAAGKPFVVTIATPAYCQTRFCGPVVDNVKSLLPQFADRANFIHFEPFQLNDDGSLAQGTDGGPIESQSMIVWRLATEPWVFVVGADGKITDRFEGTASTGEMTAALQAVLS